MSSLNACPMTVPQAKMPVPKMKMPVPVPEYTQFAGTGKTLSGQARDRHQDSHFLCKSLLSLHRDTQDSHFSKKRYRILICSIMDAVYIATAFHAQMTVLTVPTIMRVNTLRVRLGDERQGELFRDP